MKKLPFAVVTPWHRQEQLDLFLKEWGINVIPEWLFLQQDKDRSGCAVTKNRGVRRAIDAGAEVILVLDDDVFPEKDEYWLSRDICRTRVGEIGYREDCNELEWLALQHIAALNPVPVRMIEPVTEPWSRGTPYHAHHIQMPVAAAMSFWTHIGDYDACGQLVHGATKPMAFKRAAIHGKYFPLCGMALSFRAEWWPICQFIDVPRFDDIWQGFIWQKIAYSRGYCFNLAAPLVRHSRQSNVWANLRDEAPNLEHNESVWQKIHQHPNANYEELVALLPLKK